jgi:hypothetical protein
MREHRELQTLIDQLERYIKEQAEQIDSLLKIVEALVIACEQATIDEREACAVLCESLKLSDDYYTHFYVEAIRARGEK